MKKTSIALNILLLVAVGILYVLHFTGDKSVPASTPEKVITNSDGSPVQIAYVNIDSLLSQLDQYIAETASLEAKYGKRKTELEQRAGNFQKNVMDLQNKAQKGLITSSNYRIEEERLQKEQQYLGQLEQQYTYELNEENSVMTRSLMYSIMEYVEKYNADKNYKFVLNNSFGGVLLYGDKGLDITNDILQGMNSAYASQHNKK